MTFFRRKVVEHNLFLKLPISDYFPNASGFSKLCIYFGSDLFHKDAFFLGIPYLKCFRYFDVLLTF
jgi:hypothetical protein